MLDGGNPPCAGNGAGDRPRGGRCLCQQFFAVPPKRSAQRIVEYLDRHEARALLRSTDTATKEGRRDRALLLALCNTGAQVQEILDVRSRDLQLERPRQVRLCGKGRRERMCPRRGRSHLHEACLSSGLAPPASRAALGEAAGMPGMPRLPATAMSVASSIAVRFTVGNARPVPDPLS